MGGRGGSGKRKTVQLHIIHNNHVSSLPLLFPLPLSSSSPFPFCLPPPLLHLPSRSLSFLPFPSSLSPSLHLSLLPSFRHHLVLCDLLQDGFHRTFYDDQHISVIHSNDLVLAFECPPYRGENPDANSHANPSGSKELILVLVVNKFGKAQHGRR